MGALDVQKVVRDNQGWRLITCMWLHAGVVHVLANMLSLLFIGIRLEREFGFGMQQTNYSVTSFIKITTLVKAKRISSCVCGNVYMLWMPT